MKSMSPKVLCATQPETIPVHPTRLDRLNAALAELDSLGCGMYCFYLMRIAA